MKSKMVDVSCRGEDLTDGTSQLTVTIRNLSHSEAEAVGDALHWIVTRTVARVFEGMKNVESVDILNDERMH